MKVKLRLKKKIMNRIGKRIREIRLVKGISQEKLAFDVGAEKSYITNIENGLRCPSMYGLFVILEALEIDFKTFADFDV